MRGLLLVIVSISLIVVASTTGCAAPQVERPSPAARESYTVKVTGASSCYTPMEALASAFSARESGTKVVFLPGNQTVGGIAGVKDDLVDIGTVTRALKPEESVEGMQYRELDRDVLVVAVHPSVTGISELTRQQLQDVYSGKVLNWKELGGPDGRIVVLDRPEDESAKQLLRQHFIGKELRIRDNAVLLDFENELAVSLRDTPFSIGYLSLGYATLSGLSAHFLTIDGMAPDTNSARSGRYPALRSQGVVWKSSIATPAKRYLDFAFSKEGSTLLEANNYLPSAPSN